MLLPNKYNGFGMTYGEDQYVIMFGGLHIEMAVCRALGAWLDGSGWTRVLVEAGIVTSGTADLFLKVTHLTKTRHAHQVTAAALSVLQHEVYHEYSSDPGADVQPLAFDEWCEQSCKDRPHFQYWHIMLKFELTLFLLLQAQ